MKLDYDLMELEQERQREEFSRLEIKRKEERDFQLLLFSMVCQGSGSRHTCQIFIFLDKALGKATILLMTPLVFQITGHTHFPEMVFRVCNY